MENDFTLSFSKLVVEYLVNPINQNAKLTVSGAILKVNSKYNLILADYDVTFQKAKPLSNIAKTVY